LTRASTTSRLPRHAACNRRPATTSHRHMAPRVCETTIHDVQADMSYK
jgi:hypothetical protein